MLHLSLSIYIYIYIYILKVHETIGSLARGDVCQLGP